MKNGPVDHIVALSGGVGGSRFTRGLRAAAADQTRLTAVVNTGDDVTLHGLRVSPDVDTVLYALSGVVDEQRGWGPRGDSFRCMAALERLGGETWFRLGDIDRATHIRRTELLAAGWPPTQVTAELARRLGITGIAILPMTDQPVETWVQLADDGQWVHFQEYFVHRRTDAPITAVRFEGIDQARPAPGVCEALAAAELIVLCPSNPFVSIAPILALDGVRQAIHKARTQGAIVAGVSPIIGGTTVKGPAARMLVELGYEASALGAARQYADLLDLFVIDTVDARFADGVRSLGIRPVVVDAWMRGRRGEARLAGAMLRAVR